jgi:hypothetical protein
MRMTVLKTLFQVYDFAYCQFNMHRFFCNSGGGGVTCTTWNFCARRPLKIRVNTGGYLDHVQKSHLKQHIQELLISTIILLFSFMAFVFVDGTTVGVASLLASHNCLKRCVRPAYFCTLTTGMSLFFTGNLLEPHQCRARAAFWSPLLYCMLFRSKEQLYNIHRRFCCSKNSWHLSEAVWDLRLVFC